jgi:hypothetical protein
VQFLLFTLISVYNGGCFESFRTEIKDAAYERFAQGTPNINLAETELT